MQKHSLAVLALFALLVGGLVSGCGQAEAESQNAAQPEEGADAGNPFIVVCTTGMIADAARAIAGDRAVVTALMGSGTDPHLYTPTRSDFAKLIGADLILYNGLHLEGRMIDALKRAESSGMRVVAVSEELTEEQLLAPPEFKGLHDPHIWMDPTTWMHAVDSIERAMVAADPEGSEEFATAAAEYMGTVRELDSYAQGVMGTIPDSSRVLVTAHDAFNYFGRRYHMEVVGIQGLSTESEAGVRDIERLVSMLVDQNIPSVFVETTVSERNIRALIDGAGARGHQVKIGGLLFSDAMGTTGTYEGTYIGMIDHNVTTIVRALGGVAPERGMNGSLSEEGSP